MSGIHRSPHHPAPLIHKSSPPAEYRSYAVIARSEATKQSRLRRPLDCFAALAMTSEIVLAARSAPEVLITLARKAPRAKARDAERRKAHSIGAASFPCPRLPSGRRGQGPARRGPCLFLLLRLRGKLGGGPLAFRRSTAVVPPWAALPGIAGCKREDPPRRQCSEHLAVRSRAGRDVAQNRPMRNANPLREPLPLRLRTCLPGGVPR